MAAVLDKTGVSDEKEVWPGLGADGHVENVYEDGEQIPYDGTGIEVGGELWSKMNPITRAAHRLWLDGEDVYIAHEEDDLDYSKYLSADTLKYLDSIELDENWRNKNEKINISNVN